MFNVHRLNSLHSRCVRHDLVLRQFLCRSSGHTCRRWSSSETSSEASDKGTDATTSKQDEDILPFLQRPLGVDEPPSTYKKSWKERTEELMDQDVRLARRRHIVKEATKGYYADFSATKKFGGKTWVAPKTLIREDHAKYFPNVSGVPLNSKDAVNTANLCQDRISLVAMLSTEHVDSFVRPTIEKFLSDHRFQFVQINLQENILKAFLVSMYVSSLRRKVPPELHRTYLLSTQNMEYIREPLGMNNKHIGFVYLLDQQQRVRWAGGGLALPEETDSLTSCTGVLLDRYKQKRVRPT
ncbi:hypothetical protein SCHPADRAFT_834571 [Schizopora paradoxa]|uniref:F1F0 ATP synthase assembly protein Atp10 n=1 Tax=Schizopora paradoxa TaxID=27342 RepID=A0A0H2RC07_9AGAM|nr:hypothetical protein SCHPADRAFT_834571 [Schizopora paradoxa]